MKIERRGIVLCFLVLSLFVVAGCDRGTEEGTPPSTTPPSTTTPATDTKAVGVDLEKPVAELQAEAQTMSVDSLKATALKYKEAIAGKDAEIETVAAKIKEIPITQALGQEATTLKTDLQNLGASLKSLKDRFQIYYDTLKEKGGDVSGLTP